MKFNSLNADALKKSLQAKVFPFILDVEIISNLLTIRYMEVFVLWNTIKKRLI